MGWRQGRLDHTRNAHGDPFRVCLTQVQQNNHREVEVGVALQSGMAAEPGATVSDTSVSALLDEAPAESVGVRATVVEPDRGPAQLESGPAEHLAVIKPCGPLGEVSHAEA